MFREFGIPARIRRCETVLDLLTSLDEFNGKRNCYVSVYTFTGIEGKKVNYETLSKGPDHNKEFEASVFLENKAIGKGTGKSKKNAEQMAAKNAFSDIKE